MRKEALQINEKLRPIISIGLFEKLPEILNISTTRRTRILKSPRLMVWDEISKLSEIVNITAWDLVYEFECGWKTLTLEKVHEHLEAIELIYKADENNSNDN